MIIVETVKLIGEGQYNLNALKEIVVTDSYIGMDQDCQDDEHFVNCTTRQYLKTVLKECECLPFNIRLSKEVGICMNCKLGITVSSLFRHHFAPMQSK